MGAEMIEKKEKAVITIVCDYDFKEAIEREAQKQRTTVSGFIRAELLWCLNTDSENQPTK